MTVAVREATTADARAIAEVHVRAWQATYRGEMPDEYLDGLSMDRRERGWRELLEGAGHPPVWVVERGARVVGFAQAGATRDADAPPGAGELLVINVEPPAWGSGAGKALHDAAVAFLRAQGFRAATLWVSQGNARARRFYEREGWELDGAARDDDRWGGFVVHELRYRIDLTGKSQPG